MPQICMVWCSSCPARPTTPPRWARTSARLWPSARTWTAASTVWTSMRSTATWALSAHLRGSKRSPGTWLKAQMMEKELQDVDEMDYSLPLAESSDSLWHRRICSNNLKSWQRCKQLRHEIVLPEVAKLFIKSLISSKGGKLKYVYCMLRVIYNAKA